MALDDAAESVLEVPIAVGVQERIDGRVEIGQPEGGRVEHRRHTLRVDGTEIEDEVERYPARQVREDDVGEGDERLSLLKKTEKKNVYLTRCFLVRRPKNKAHTTPLACRSPGYI